MNKHDCQACGNECIDEIEQGLCPDCRIEALILLRAEVKKLKAHEDCELGSECPCYEKGHDDGYVAGVAVE